MSKLSAAVPSIARLGGAGVARGIRRSYLFSTLPRRPSQSFRVACGSSDFSGGSKHTIATLSAASKYDFVNARCSARNTRSLTQASGNVESPLDSSHEDMLSQSERHFHGKAFVSSATAAMFELAEYHETIKSPLCLSVNSGLDEEAGASPGTSVTLHVSGGGSPDTIFQLRYDIGGPRANDDADEDDECSRTKDQREEGYLYFTSPVGGSYQYEPRVVVRRGKEYVEWHSTKDAHNLEGLLVRDLTRYTYGTLTMKPRPR